MCVCASWFYVILIIQARVNWGESISLEIAPTKLAHGQACEGSFGLVVDVGGPRPLWHWHAIFSPGGIYEVRLSKS